MPGAERLTGITDIQAQGEAAVTAVDAPSLQQLLTRNPAALAAGIANAVVSGNADDAVAAIRTA